MNPRSPRSMFAAGLSLLWLGGCGLLNPAAEKTLYLDHYMEECASFFLTICERAKEREGDPWRTRLDGIEGFSYEWGFVYELRVRESRIINPPADGSSIRTELVEIVRKEKVPSTNRFQIALTKLVRDEPAVVAVGERLFEFHNTKTFACITDALCADIRTLVAQAGVLTLEFTHAETSDDPLLARRIVSFEAYQP